MNKQTAFSAPMGGSAGGAMTFWWQQVNNYDQYANWTPAVEYFKLLPDDFILMNTLTKEGYTVGGPTRREWLYTALSAPMRYTLTSPTCSTIMQIPTPARLPIRRSNLQVLQTARIPCRCSIRTRGKVAKTFDAAAAGGKLSISLESWACDLALIIDRKA